MIPGYPQPRLSEEVKVLRVESRDFEVEAQKELGCPRAVGLSRSTKTGWGIFANVCGDYTAPVV